MFNLGAGEVLVIMLLALIVLGPQRLPDAARQIGKFTGEIRRLSSGFQQEMKSAFEAETEAAARARGAEVTDADAAEGVDLEGVDLEGVDLEGDDLDGDDLEDDHPEVEDTDAPEPAAGDDTTA